jgi:hypothetical protein
MGYDNHDYWVSGLYLLSEILNIRKQGFPTKQVFSGV